MNPINRLVVVETVYHAPSVDRPVSVDGSFSTWLSSDESPCGPRFSFAGEEWEQIDSGWIKQASMVSISNVEGKHHQVVPSAEEKVVIASKIIEVAVRGGEAHPFLVRPGQSMRFCPSDLSTLLVRCRAGRAKFNITIFPS